MISTREGFLVGLLLVLPLVSPLESANPVAVMPGTLMGDTIGLWFGYEAVRCICCWRRLTDCREATFWGVCIYYIPTSVALVTSNTNSVCYFQLLDFLTWSFSPTWLITSCGGRWRATELSSYISIPFTQGMDEDSYTLTSALPGWANQLGTLVEWDSLSISVWVNLLKYYSRICIADEPDGFWMLYELAEPLEALIDY